MADGDVEGARDVVSSKEGTAMSVLLLSIPEIGLYLILLIALTTPART